MPKINKKLFLVVLVIFSPFTQASDLGGMVYMGYYLPTTKPLHARALGNTVELSLEGKHTVNEQVSAKWKLLFDHHLPSRLRIQEAYGQYANEGFDFKLGQQALVWGTSDGINPTNYFEAKRLSLFRSNEEAKSLGSPLLVSSYRVEGRVPLTFTVVQGFAFTPSVYTPKNGSPKPNGVDRPKDSLEDSETAFKVAYAAPDFDTSISAYRGWTHLAEYALEGPAFIQTHRRKKSIGIDASVSSENYVYRAEAAFHKIEMASALNPAVLPSNVEIVLGVERPFYDSQFRIQAQTVFKHYLNWTKPESVSGPAALLALLNSSLHHFQDQTKRALTFRISYEPKDSKWSFETFALVQAGGNWVGKFLNKDGLVQPKITYAWANALKTSVGVDHYWGDSSRSFGSLSDRNAVYIESSLKF